MLTDGFFSFSSGTNKQTSKNQGKKSSTTQELYNSIKPVCFFTLVTKQLILHLAFLHTERKWTLHFHLKTKCLTYCWCITIKWLLSNTIWCAIENGKVKVAGDAGVEKKKEKEKSLHAWCQVTFSVHFSGQSWP